LREAGRWGGGIESEAGELCVKGFVDKRRVGVGWLGICGMKRSVGMCKMSGGRRRAGGRMGGLVQQKGYMEALWCTAVGRWSKAEVNL